MNKFFNFMFFAAAAGILAAGTASAADENTQDSTPSAADSQITQNNDGTYTVTTTNGNTVTKTKYNSKTTINCESTKIACIKTVREITGMGLKEAKEYVERDIYAVDLSDYDSDKIKAAAEKNGLSYGLSYEGNKKLSAEIYENGRLTTRENYNNNGEVASSEEYKYENGSLTAKENYKNGKLESTDNYKNGYKVSTTYPAAGEIDCSSSKIKCIKALRDATGWGLKEAKDYVDGNLNNGKLDLSKLDTKYAAGVCSYMGVECPDRTEYYNTKTRFTPPEASVFMTDDGNNSVTITF